MTWFPSTRLAFRCIRFTCAALVLGAGAYAVGPAVARAANSDPSVARFHLTLRRSVPAADSTVAAAASISLWFSEAPPLKETTIRLLKADSSVVTLAALTRTSAADAPVVAAIRSPLAPGRYRVMWSAPADDGDLAKGTFLFTVRATH